jgi:hypothetical protein
MLALELVQNYLLHNIFFILILYSNVPLFLYQVTALQDV